MIRRDFTVHVEKLDNTRVRVSVGSDHDTGSWRIMHIEDAENLWKLIAKYELNIGFKIHDDENTELLCYGETVTAALQMSPPYSVYLWQCGEERGACRTLVAAQAVAHVLSKEPGAWVYRPHNKTWYYNGHTTVVHAMMQE